MEFTLEVLLQSESTTPLQREEIKEMEAKDSGEERNDTRASLCDGDDRGKRGGEQRSLLETKMMTVSHLFCAPVRHEMAEYLQIKWRRGRERNSQTANLHNVLYEYCRI